MKLHADSHLDHGLTARQLAHVLTRFADRDAFFIETFELPEDLGTVPCGLYGPAVGDRPVIGERWDPRPDHPFPAPISAKRRGDRPYTSRVVGLPPRPTRTITVIAGPHDGQPCVLFTVFGGPIAPQEPGDVRRQMEALEAKRRELEYRGDEHDKVYTQIVKLREKRDEADAFWALHALASDG